MNVIELNRALRQLRLGGMAAVLETRLHQAQAEPMPPIDFLSCLVADELQRPTTRPACRSHHRWHTQRAHGAVHLSAAADHR
jgi:hypothetical protein